MTKKRVGILFGGVSPEHAVSIASAKNIARAIPRTNYDVFLVYVTRTGIWQWVDFSETGMEVHFSFLTLSPSTDHQLHLHHQNAELVLDLVFPIIHGLLGEDGCLQGLLESFQVPYVGAGVLASAVGMDKDICRRVVEKAGVKSLPYIAVDDSVLSDLSTLQARCEENFDYPWFVKPANTGSSVAVSKVKSANDFVKAVLLAFEYDDKVLIEKGLSELHEVEIAALGSTQDLILTPCVEIIPHKEFYDYEAKYQDKATMVLPAEISQTEEQTIRRYAEIVFREIDCDAMARIDFLIDKKTETVYFSEINTLPGFTAISQYPRLCEAAGYDQSTLMDRLLQLALSRAMHQHSKRARNERVNAYV